MQQAVGQRQVRAGQRLQVQVRAGRGRGPARVDDDVPWRPAARPASKYCMAGGIVSAGLAPTSSIACASAMSASGNGSPRSMPNARLAAVAADDMQNRPL